VIVGAVLGSLAALLVVGLVVLFALRRQRSAVPAPRSDSNYGDIEDVRRSASAFRP